MPIEVSQKLLLERYHGDSGKKDIHESHLGFLRACRESARYAGQRLGWREIPAPKTGAPAGGGNPPGGAGGRVPLLEKT